MMANLLNYIVWDPDPILFHLGPIALRYYATCWLVGLLLGYLLMQRLYRQQKIGDEKFEPLFIYIFIGILAGARLGHCLFYQPEYFLSQWDHVVEMLIPMHHLPDGSWKFTGYEGLASHGGVIGLFVAIWLYCRNLKVKGWVVLDNMGICSGIAAAFIRIGNLMNSEIIGKVTDLPWAIAYLIIFLLIFFIYKKKGPKSVGSGLYFGLCLTLIFTFRFFIEYTKEIQVAFEAGLPMDMGQILSIPLILLGVWSIVSSFRRAKKIQA